MKVWVLETGCYEDRRVTGVFLTPQKAMAAWAPKREDAPDSHSYAWEGPDGLGEYAFGADWGDAAVIRPMEIDAPP